MSAVVTEPILVTRRIRLADPCGLRESWRKVILKRDPCAYCGLVKPGRMNRDHIVPVFAGGEKEGGRNITASCCCCNTAKSHTPMLHYLLSLR